MRRTEILLEGIRSDFRAVAEGHSVLNRKMDNLDVDFKNEIKEVREEIKFVANTLKGEIKDSNNSIKSLANTLKDEIKVTNDSIKFLANTLKDVAKELGNKIDKVDFKLDAHIRQPA